MKCRRSEHFINVTEKNPYIKKYLSKVDISGKKRTSVQQISYTGAY
jgi:hypothetical protein